MTVYTKLGNDPTAQHMIALRRGNEVRLRRACMLRALENDDVALADALADAAIQDVKIGEVVERCSFGRPRIRRDDARRMGPRRQKQAARRLLASLGPNGMSPTIPVSALADSRRRELVDAYTACVAHR